MSRDYTYAFITISIKTFSTKQRGIFRSILYPVCYAIDYVNDATL